MKSKILLPLLCLSLLMSVALADNILTASAASYKVGAWGPGFLADIKGEKYDKSCIVHQEYNVDANGEDYWYYEVSNKNGNVQIHVLNKNLKCYDFEFDKANNVVFRAAYFHFIIVEEVDCYNNSVAYWVLNIVEDNQCFTLDSWCVNSQVDNEKYQFANNYTLTSILEYDVKKQFLYVSLVACKDYDVYKIDVGTKSNTLVAVGWFFFSHKKKQNIIGGNSRVLVDATCDKFLVDTRNDRCNISDPTVYKKVDPATLTCNPIYPGGSQVYNFLGSYFQYVSLSKDQLKMSTFLYHGYGNKSVLNEGKLCSECKPILFYSDQKTFFIAVADNDIYVSTVNYNCSTQKYDVATFYLSDFKLTDAQNKQIIDFYRNALVVVSANNLFNLLTSTQFAIPGYWSANLPCTIDADDNLAKIIFKYIKYYEDNIANTAAANANTGSWWGYHRKN